MELEKHYEDLYQSSFKKIAEGKYQIDPKIESKSDSRYGITLLIRPDEKTKKRISEFLHQVHDIEPDQYFYPEVDMHITVLSIISCYEGFQLTDINPSDYVKVIQKSLLGIKPFSIRISGLTLSDSCILTRGFQDDGTLNQIRENLRDNFKETSLQSSIDQRYSIKTAHSTIVRFKNPLSDQSLFLDKMEETKNFDFGTFEVSQLELVANDWYQRQENTVLISTFDLDI